MVDSSAMDAIDNDPSTTVVQNANGRDLSFLPTRTQLFVLLGLFFLIQAVSRGLISETLGLDDAEQALLAQKWSWGYGPQPPIYTWLVILISKTIGITSFSMALLKNAFLFGIYVLAYLNLRWLTHSHAAGVAAAAAMELMPSIAYEAQRELTHSVLASMFVLTTLLVFLRLKPERFAGYLLFGIVVGCGFLSKYNFLIVFAGLLLAAVSTRFWRRHVMNWRMGVATGIAVVIALPNLLWILANKNLAFSSVYKFSIDQGHHFFSILQGLRRASLDCIGQIILLGAIAALLFWRSPSRSHKTLTNGERLLGRLLLWEIILVIASICGFAVTESHSRWFQPLLVIFPIFAISIASHSFSPTRLKIFLGLSVATAVVMILVAPGRILLTETLHKNEILNAPFREFAQEIKEPISHAHCVFSNDRWLAGNLRVWFPKKTITATGITGLYPPNSESTIVWDASQKKIPPSPIIGTHYSKPIVYEARLKYHATTTMKIGLITPVTSKTIGAK